MPILPVLATRNDSAQNRFISSAIIKRLKDSFRVERRGERQRRYLLGLEREYYRQENSSLKSVLGR